MTVLFPRVFEEKSWDRSGRWEGDFQREKPNQTIRSLHSIEFLVISSWYVEFSILFYSTFVSLIITLPSPMNFFDSSPPSMRSIWFLFNHLVDLSYFWLVGKCEVDCGAHVGSGIVTEACWFRIVGFAMFSWAVEQCFLVHLNSDQSIVDFIKFCCNKRFSDFKCLE